MTDAPQPNDSLSDLLCSASQEEQETLLAEMGEAEQEELLSLLPLWRPLPGPQTAAYETDADILFYGGAAGGGKTDLSLGLAGTKHQRSVMFRRIFPSHSWAIQRAQKLFGDAGDYNTQSHTWMLRPERMLRFGSLQYEDDVKAWQGQPHDLQLWDELPEFTETQFRFVTGWNRTTDEGQRCRVVCTGNPPTDSDGEWVVRFFAPWLDDSHPNPAKPGELRWFTTVSGKDQEMPNGEPVMLDGLLVKPLSRTFIPARLADNPYLARTGYAARLNALPEPLRSKMLFGDFKAGREDNAYQAIPTAWVDAAQKRWRERVAREGKPKTPMSCLGVDVARGGKDFTVRAPRYGNFVDELRRAPGANTPDGQRTAALIETDIVGHAGCLVQVDVIGVGGSVIDSLRNGWVDGDGDQHPGLGRRAVAMNASEGSDQQDKSGTLGYVNQRAEWTWSVREMLDPASGQDICLPPDPQLKADLCALRWKLTPRGIKIELKDEVKDRIGRSPDDGDAVINALAIKHIAGTGLLDYARAEMERLAAAKAAKG